jgi:hypothetical protein
MLMVSNFKTYTEKDTDELIKTYDMILMAVSYPPNLLTLLEFNEGKFKLIFFTRLINI